ncbi:hypothetical protein D1BOALGB6SA_9918 [Olavius sp. associated proteobacterium Delta 1]|nr:hypothetical protein D1BOALGB6SA_9918 [Olavius sp. associated proteobacterium Delta 1]
MKKACLSTVIVTCLIISNISYANDALHHKLSEELIELLDIKNNIEKSFAQIEQMQIENMEQTMENGMSEQDKNEFSKLFLTLLNYEAIKKDFINLYSDTFTIAELKGLIVFFKSPIGKTYINKTPELTNKMIELNQKYMLDAIPKIQSFVEKMIYKNK